MGAEDYNLLQRNAFGALSELPEDYGDCAVVDYPWRFVNQDRPGRASFENDDDWDMADNDRLEGVLRDVRNAVSDGGYVFVFADDDVLPQFRRAAEDTLEYRKTLIWDTERIGNGHYFRSRHGYIIAATVGDTDRYVMDRPTVLESPAPQREPGVTTEYPTEKPVGLYRQLLGSPVLQEGDRLLEPFCGTAPGGAVAFERYWGCDVANAAMERAEDRFAQSRIGQQTFADAEE